MRSRKQQRSDASGRSEHGTSKQQRHVKERWPPAAPAARGRKVHSVWKDEWDTPADLARKKRLLISLGWAKGSDRFVPCSRTYAFHTAREKRMMRAQSNRRRRLTQWRAPITAHAFRDRKGK
jgi:hypothetical protein